MITPLKHWFQNVKISTAGATVGMAFVGASLMLWPKVMGPISILLLIGYSATQCLPRSKQSQTEPTRTMDELPFKPVADGNTTIPSLPQTRLEAMLSQNNALLQQAESLILVMQQLHECRQVSAEPKVQLLLENAKSELAAVLKFLDTLKDNLQENERKQLAIMQALWQERDAVSAIKTPKPITVAPAITA